MKAFEKKIPKKRILLTIDEDSLDLFDKIVGSRARSGSINELVDAFNKEHKHRIEQQSKERKK